MKLETKNDVYELLESSVATAALGTAIETGLLWSLAVQPLSALEIAQRLGIPGNRCHYWLQLLKTIGILDGGPDRYKPSSLAYEAILDTHSQASWQHLVLDERERSAGVHNLALHFSAPGSIWAAQGLAEPKDYVEKMRDSPARAREFTRMLFEVHQNLANQIAEWLDLTDVKRMMDLGGGSGVVSMALLRKYPALTATVMDIENVCIAGREIAHEKGLSDRLTYHPAEFTSDEFPTGFDMVLQCDVGVFSTTLYQKLWRSLGPGGRLTIVDHFSPAENTAPESRLEWSFLDSLQDPNFSLPTVDQLKDQLAQAGFYLLPEGQALGTGWTLLEARKGSPA